MGLIEDHERIDAGRRLFAYKERVVNFIQQIRLNLDNVNQIKTDYPADVSEIDGYIVQMKNALQQILNDY